MTITTIITIITTIIIIIIITIIIIIIIIIIEHEDLHLAEVVTAIFVFFDRLGEKVRPGTLGEIRVG